jgi:hypothetical protein
MRRAWSLLSSLPGLNYQNPQGRGTDEYLGLYIASRHIRPKVTVVSSGREEVTGFASAREIAGKDEKGCRSVGIDA